MVVGPWRLDRMYGLVVRQVGGEIEGEGMYEGGWLEVGGGKERDRYTPPLRSYGVTPCLVEPLQMLAS